MKTFDDILTFGCFLRHIKVRSSEFPIYIFYSTTRIGREFPFFQPTGPKYVLRTTRLPEIIVPEKQTQKS